MFLRKYIYIHCNNITLINESFPTKKQNLYKKNFLLYVKFRIKFKQMES